MSLRSRAALTAGWLAAWIGIAGVLPAESQSPGRPLLSLPAPAAGRDSTGTVIAVARPAPMTVQIEPHELGAPIPPGFLGLAMEYPALAAYAGADPHAVNPVFVQLIHNLAAHPVLRIGGDSTDWTWWPVPGRRRPPGVNFNLTRNWLATAKALAQATDAHLILGINLEANSSTIASAEARALLSGIGRRRVHALEIGNEPDLYGVFPWNHTRAGRPIPGRPASYGFNKFSGEFTRVRRALPPVSLAGPASSDFSWLPDLPRFLASEPNVREVTYHRYPLNRCIQTRSSASYPTVPNLLTRDSTLRLMRVVAPYIASAHRHGVSFRVDEMNGVTCGGVWGISDTFASALWALNAMYVVARSGANGVNIQTSPFPGTPNELFTFRHQAGRWLASVRPEYYGLMMFADAAPPGSRFLQVTASSSGPVHSWATLTPNGQVHVVLINDSLKSARSVLVRPATPSASAALQRLQAPSPYATHEITLAGHSFDSPSATGALSGPSSIPVLKPAHGEYTVQVPAASAAVLTISLFATPTSKLSGWWPSGSTLQPHPEG